MQKRIINFSVKEDTETNTVQLRNHEAVIGYEGENGATLVKFNLPESWLAEPEKKYQICIQSADGKKYLTDILNEPEFSLPSAVMLKGSLFIQLLTTDNEGKIIKKTEVCKCIVGGSIVGDEVMLSDEGLRLTDEVAKNLNNAVELAKEIKSELEADINSASSGLFEITNLSIAFDENLTPLKTQRGDKLSGGSFTGCSNAKTVYIPSYVTMADTGSFEHCDNLTDIYINQPRHGQHMIFTEGALLDGVSLHYRDDEDFGEFRLYDCFVRTLMSHEKKINELSSSVADAESKSNKVSSKSAITNYEDNYPSIEYLKENCAEITDVSGLHAKLAIAFDSENKPIAVMEIENSISAGVFTELPSAKTIYIPSRLMQAQSGAFTNSTNITDMYINQPRNGSHILFAEGSLPSENNIKFHYKDDDDFNDFTIIDCLVKSSVELNEYANTNSGFSVFDNKSPEWKTINEISAWSFKPNSIYIAPASMQNNVITDLPSAAYLLGWPKMIITLGGDENSRPVSFTDTYATDRYIPEGSTPTGTFPFGGTIQILITEKRRWYRTKFGDVNGYSSWIMWGIDFHGNATAADFSNNLLSDITHNSIIRLNNASLVTDTPNNDKTSVTIETKSPNYTDTGDEKAIVQQAYYYRSDQSTDSIYVRISKASDGSYSPWEAYILSSNLESHLKQSEHIKALEARIAALEKNN